MAKGGSFENEVCRILSLWWTDNRRDDVFTRTGGSGGKFTSRSKRGKNTAYQSGDITFADPIGEPLIKRYNIECKTGYGRKTDKGVARWDVLDIIDSKQKVSVIYSMWNQCWEDAEKSKRIPALIFRRNMRSPCIVVTIKEFSAIGEKRGVPILETITIENPYALEDSLIIMSLKTFVSWVERPQQFYKKELL